MCRSVQRWGLVGLHVLALGAVSRAELRGQRADAAARPPAGSYASCAEAWGLWETLVLHEGRFRRSRVTDGSERTVHVGTYRQLGSRLVLFSDSGPPQPDDIIVGGPMRFDTFTFIVDSVGSVSVLWRHEKARAAYAATGVLNKFGLLVGTGAPAEEVEHPYCQDELRIR